MSIKKLVIVTIISILVAFICGLLDIDKIYMYIINGICIGILMGLDLVWFIRKDFRMENLISNIENVIQGHYIIILALVLVGIITYIESEKAGNK